MVKEWLRARGAAQNVPGYGAAVDQHVLATM